MVFYNSLLDILIANGSVRLNVVWALILAVHPINDITVIVARPATITCDDAIEYEISTNSLTHPYIVYL